MHFVDPRDLKLPAYMSERQKAAQRSVIRAIVSADLGQSQDYTAIAVLDYSNAIPVVRGLERMRGIPYVAPTIGGIGVVERVGAIVSDVARRVHHLTADDELTPAQRLSVPLVIDRTGVGQGVYDLFVRFGLKPIGITITGGNKPSAGPQGFNVPKKDLVFSLVAAFQSGRIKIAGNLAEAPNLVNELQNFKMKIRDNGGASYEAWREGIHDDIVLAVAMNYWLHDHMTKRKSKTARVITRAVDDDE